MGRSPGLRARFEDLLARHWWQEGLSLMARLLLPLSWIYGLLAARHRAVANAGGRAPVPVLVVGNYIAGGAGKTPVVIAIVQALLAAGHRPGVLSRGYGRKDRRAREVDPDDDAMAVGDEPLLIERRASVPTWVGRDRLEAARGLCARHPEVDVLVSDDGLQHLGLGRDAELVVFDERGIGNGRLLPAGPLRQPLPAVVPRHARVLYTSGQVSTHLPGFLALRTIAAAWPLAAWLDGDPAAARPLAALRGQPLLAVAGLAAPEKFFAMLEAEGLQIERLPLADHHVYRSLPWPEDAPRVITTEKDAVKINPGRIGATQVWVVPLDLQLPPALVGELMALLFGPGSAPPPP